jgi:hypothetical protein
MPGPSLAVKQGREENVEKKSVIKAYPTGCRRSGEVTTNASGCKGGMCRQEMLPPGFQESGETQRVSLLWKESLQCHSWWLSTRAEGDVRRSHG